jgi:predicted esterase
MSSVSCTPGEISMCACTNGTTSQQLCNASGVFDPCPCATPVGNTGGGFATGGTTSFPSGTGGFVATGGTTELPPPSGGAGGEFVIPPTGGSPPIEGTGGVPPVEGTGGAGPLPPGNKDPVVPPLTAQCPPFVNSTITFMGLGGIRLVAGPKAPSPTAPIVFYWHGTGSNSGEFAGLAPSVNQGVVAEGGVLVSFQGTTGGDLSSGTSIFGAGDLNLVDQLFACAVRDHNVDPRRVYATGCSAGGLFSTAMAVNRSSYVAAAAPNSGGLILPPRFQNDYTPALMTIHGGNDVVGVNFADTSKTADDAFKGRGGFVINCNHGAGHCGFTGQAAGLSDDIWQFFTAHPYGVDPKPWTGGLPGGFDAACKIY